MLSKVFSATIIGLDAVPVEVEVAIASQGLPSFTIVGLPDKAGEEAKERVRSAIRNSGADFPARKITVNFAPASIAELLSKNALIYQRPFRSPHHTISLVGFIGGGTNPRSGEITLTHRGVLFLDEFPEFPRNVLESLRQPIEDTMVFISHAKGKTTFPAKCILIASQNPCPCGYLGDKLHTCICTAGLISRYKKKNSGSLLDRIDIHLDVPAVKVEKLTEQDANNVENSTVVRNRVQKARDIQNKRFHGTTITSNAELTNKTIKTYCPLSDDGITLLRQAVASMGLSGRAYYRIIKLSRTIADLVDTDDILPEHTAEALQYRPKGEMLQ